MQLRKVPDPVLRTKVSLVGKDENIDNLLGAMTSTMILSNGVGLAANQVGVDRAVFTYNFEDNFGFIVNPLLMHGTGRVANIEGCLSIPGQEFYVPRYKEIEITYMDYGTKKLKYMSLYGHLARIFQHEMDHLSGKLICDYEKEKIHHK